MVSLLLSTSLTHYIYISLLHLIKYFRRLLSVVISFYELLTTFQPSPSTMSTLDLAKVGNLIAELQTPEGEVAMAFVLNNKKKAASATPSPKPVLKPSLKPSSKSEPDPKALKANTVVQSVEEVKDNAPPNAKKIKVEPGTKMPTRSHSAKAALKIESDDEDNDPAMKKFKKESAKITERFRVGVDTYLRTKTGNVLTGFDTIEDLEAGFEGRKRFLRLIYKPIHRVWIQVRQPKDIEAKGLNDFLVEVKARWNLTPEEELVFRNMPKRKTD